MKQPSQIPPQAALSISAIIAEFGYLVDIGRAAESTELFTSDAVLVFGPGSPKPGVLNGLEAIRGYLENRQRATHVMTRHLPSNIRFEAQDDMTIVASYYITLYRSEDGSREPRVAMIADMVDTFSRDEEDHWWIKHRIVTPFLKAK